MAGELIALTKMAAGGKLAYATYPYIGTDPTNRTGLLTYRRQYVSHSIMGGQYATLPGWPRTSLGGRQFAAPWGDYGTAGLRVGLSPFTLINPDTHFQGFPDNLIGKIYRGNTSKEDSPFFWWRDDGHGNQLGCLFSFVITQHRTGRYELAVIGQEGNYNGDMLNTWHIDTFFGPYDRRVCTGGVWAKGIWTRGTDADAIAVAEREELDVQYNCFRLPDTGGLRITWRLV